MDRKIKKIKLKNGFTLIELLVVIVIISILTYFFMKPIINRINAHKVEEETKKIYGLLQEGRMFAFTRKKELQFEIKTGTACLYDIDNTPIRCISLNLPFTPAAVKIDDRGVFESQTTISYIGEYESPTVDCIKISYIRIRMGKLQNGECILK
ncbi:pilus assembly FimT family protein [Persephonella sp.]